jgi:hypothetical protein
MRLASVAAADAGEAELQKLAEPILAFQRPDGGSAQKAGLHRPVNTFFEGALSSDRRLSGSDLDDRIVTRCAGDLT